MKSNVSDHLELVQAIYKDACAKCTADVSDLRDIKTLISRVKDEGISFLTITLPSFCRDFETSLQDGYVSSTLFAGFRKNGSIPAFLQGMISLVFNRETGRIFDDQSTGRISDRPVVIDSIRQVCLAFKKIELDCAPERVAAALANFIEVEHVNQSFSPSTEEIQAFSLVSSVLWGNSLATISLQDLRPKHGPGATADHITGNGKYVWRSWHDRLEPFFPLLDCAYSISAYQSEEFEQVTIIMPEQEQPVKVITVPKTLKGPRIIAIEPCCMQYAQQAILRVLVDTIESSKLTSGHINFRDQSVNQELALVSSKTGRFATIDLSDASDRVPLSLVKDMFQSNPDLWGAIEACRTTSAKMPDGEIISPLSKFASMGSALCFPVESMYFYTICVMALLDAQNLAVNHANVLYVSRDVFVYGDDIVVPQTYAVVVLNYLQKYNCKVNTSKTFITGRFRESCGVDAYDGELVTPVYISRQMPKNQQQVSELVSWVATANLFYKKGYWNTATFMFCTCERLLGSLPYVSETSPVLGRISLRGYRSIERWDVEHHRFEMKGWVPRPVYRSDSIDGYSALQKSLDTLERGDQATESHGTWSNDVCQSITSRDVQHLKRTALHGAVALTRRWVSSAF